MACPVGGIRATDNNIEDVKVDSVAKVLDKFLKERSKILVKEDLQHWIQLEWPNHNDFTNLSKQHWNGGSVKQWKFVFLLCNTDCA